MNSEGRTLIRWVVFCFYIFMTNLKRKQANLFYYQKNDYSICRNSHLNINYFYFQNKTNNILRISIFSTHFSFEMENLRESFVIYERKCFAKGRKSYENAWVSCKSLRWCYKSIDNLWRNPILHRFTSTIFLTSSHLTVSTSKSKQNTQWAANKQQQKIATCYRNFIK